MKRGATPQPPLRKVILTHPDHGRLETVMWGNGEPVDPLTGWTVSIDKLIARGWTVEVEA